MNKHLKDSIEEIKDFQQKFEELTTIAAKNSESVVDGTTTIEEEMKEPANVLFHQITENSIRILQSPEMEKIFDTIAKEIGAESVKALINLMAITMTTSAFQAITFYDELLKIELTKQIDNMGDHINNNKADIEAHKNVLQVHQKQLQLINDKLQVDDLKKVHPNSDIK